ncbi:Oxygen regulatory protein NreC [compost metagenome]
MRNIRVLICDDHPLLRSGLRLVLEAEPALEVVGEAGDGVEVLSQVAALEPDLVLMDISLPKINGLKATASIFKQFPEVKVLLLSMHESKEYVTEALKAGASGYVPKKAVDSELITAIHRIHEGHLFIHPSLHYDEADEATAIAIHKARRTKAVLSPREQDLLKLVAEGYSNAEIAQRLQIHLHTVENHRANMMRKLGFQRRADIVRYAIASGLLQPMS